MSARCDLVAALDHRKETRIADGGPGLDLCEFVTDRNVLFVREDLMALGCCGQIIREKVPTREYDLFVTRESRLRSGQRQAGRIYKSSPEERDAGRHSRPYGAANAYYRNSQYSFRHTKTLSLQQSDG